MKRRHVLGELYSRCDRFESIPVYMEEKSDEPIGHVDESMGVFADTYLFHLPADISKKLSTSHYQFGFNYDHSGEATPGTKRRISLNYILLISSKTALPRRAAGSHSVAKAIAD